MSTALTGAASTSVAASAAVIFSMLGSVSELKGLDWARRVYIYDYIVALA